MEPYGLAGQSTLGQKILLDELQLALFAHFQRADAKKIIDTILASPLT
jgi:hypothetical protein